MTNRARAVCALTLVVATAIAPAAGGAPREQPPAELWRAFPLEPVRTAEEPPTPPVAATSAARGTPTRQVAVEEPSFGLSPFAIAAVAFGFAMAGTALAIALWVTIQAVGRRAGHRPREPIVAPKPFASIQARTLREAEAPTAPAPVAPQPAVPAPVVPAASAAATSLVDALQPSSRRAPRPQPDERTYTVELWRGYVKWRYYATTVGPGEVERTIAASPFFRPERGVPLEESVAAREAYEALLAELDELGWPTADAGGPFALAGRNQST
jgi:hypothetical protein